MHLLDFPPEIFQNIVHELATDLGACAVWKLRKVCRTFAAEIEYDVFAKQPKELFEKCVRNPAEVCPVLKNNVPRYLANRARLPLDVEVSFLNKLDTMLLYLTEELRLSTPEQQQEYAAKLREGVVELLGPSAVLGFLWGTLNVDAHVEPKSLSIRDKIVVAILGDASDLVCTLISNLSEPAESFLFGHDFAVKPLSCAVSLRNSNMVDTILDCVLRPKLGGRSHYETFTSHYHGFRIADAMRLAIKKKAPRKILQSLLSVHQSHCSLERADYELWLTSAIRTGSVDIVKFVLGIERHGRVKVTRGHLITACKLGVPAVVAALLAKKLMDPNKKFLNTTPLIAAVRSGHLDVIKAVLNAGADINGSVAKHPYTPLEAAKLEAAKSERHRYTAVFELLLAHGAKEKRRESQEK